MDKIILNTMAIDLVGNGIPSTLTATRKGQYGMTLYGVPDNKAKEIILKAMTAVQAQGFKIPHHGINFKIKDCGWTADSSTMAVATAALILSGQIVPKAAIEDYVFCGDLHLDGKTKETFVRNSEGKLWKWPFKTTQVLTDDRRMHVVADGMDKNAELTLRGPYFVEVKDLKMIKAMLEDKNIII